MHRQPEPSTQIADLQGQLPETTVPKSFVDQDVKNTAIALVNDLREQDLADFAIWRDLLCLTGTFRTFYSATKVASAFRGLSTIKKRSTINLTDRPARYSGSLGDSSWYDVDVVFHTEEGELKGEASGIVSICLDHAGDYRVWMIRTWLEAFQGHGHPDTMQPPPLTNGSSSSTSGSNGHAATNGTNNTNGSHEKIYDAVVAGGGQSGLSLGGRLQALSVDYVVLERTPEVGDVWKNRYDSLTWHTVKEYGELPFGRTFKSDEPVLIPTKRIASAHHEWASKWKINVHGGTNVEHADWNETTQLWTIRTTTTSGDQKTYFSRNLILAIGGGSSIPSYPLWAHPSQTLASGFKGTLLHGKDYHNADTWHGLRGVVVGTANTGHDVAEDMQRAGMHTTMLQRSPTFVLPAEWLHHAQVIDYNPGVPTERADRDANTYPTVVMSRLINRGVHAQIRAHPERFDGLEKAGFLLDRFGDLTTNLFIRGGGHYIDTGASRKIAEGKIRMETRRVTRLGEDGLVFEDGSRLDADVIVLCTGFQHDFREEARVVIGDAADRMAEYRGLDREGEQRGLSKPAGHPHLYYHGGDVRAGRWLSRFIALRIQAETLGAEFPAYLDEPL